MLNDSVGGEDVVEVAGGVVLLGRCVVGDPIPVDDKLQKGWQSACGRERRFLVEQRGTVGESASGKIWRGVAAASDPS